MKTNVTRKERAFKNMFVDSDKIIRKIAFLEESEDKAIRAARKEVQTDSDTYLTVEKTSQFTGPPVSTD